LAARLNRRHQEAIREKIRASQLVNRLESHVLDDLDLSSTQDDTVTVEGITNLTVTFPQVGRDSDG
jgi:hypothetical protein